jgi:hypothetical protein
LSDTDNTARRADGSGDPAARIAGALVAAGYDPPPAVGQVWQDLTASYLPSPQRRLVRVTGIGNTVSGWQCRVLAWVEDPDATTAPERRGGVLYVATLLDDYQCVSCPAPSPDGMPCARIIPAGWAIGDGHPGGHVWMSPDTQDLLDRGHYDPTAALAGQPFAAHLPEDCPPGCSHPRT